MGIEDLKRWHWIAIGVVVGVALAGARLMVQPDETDSADTRISAETFVYGFGQTTGGKLNLPLFRNVIVYPTQENLDYVTAEQLMPVPGTKKYQYRPVSFHGVRPFKPGGRDVASVRDFLERAKKNKPDASYSYAWWTDSRFVWVTWIGGSVLVIGVIWPTLLNFMIGAGWGRQRKERETFDLSRFKGEGSKSEEKPSITQGDLDQLQALEAQLQEKLKASGDGHAEATTVATEAPVRELSAGPVEEAPVTKPEEDQEYKGEFYPVARPHGKKEE